MMHMTLYWGKDVTLLFDSWETDSWASYSLSLVACFLFSTFYQYLEDRRIRFKAYAISSSSSNPQLRAPLLRKLGRLSLVKLYIAALFGVNSALGYLLMLAIMSFNGGVFLAIVLGLSVGYFFFRFDDGGEVVVVENTCACA
ncbi:Ctr domain-containing protein [Cephalotus follicularis]|uniref:Copper transport protein n=1 Tax=Cephalotus follicularis TaxID=3775 RepID=A0A1Q3B9U1_CEPFO|nr:Ctr domain-containing protein [Cephalotus follicularis]